MEPIDITKQITELLTEIDKTNPITQTLEIIQDTIENKQETKLSNTRSTLSKNNKHDRKAIKTIPRRKYYPKWSQAKQRRDLAELKASSPMPMKKN